MRPSSSAGSAALLPCTLNLRTPALLPSPSSFKKLFRSSRKLRLEKEVITLRLFGSLGRPFLPPSPVSEAVLLLPLPAATLVPRLGGGKLLWTHLRDRRPAPAQSPPREGRLVSACGGRGTEYGGGGERDRERERQIVFRRKRTHPSRAQLTCSAPTPFDFYPFKSLLTSQTVPGGAQTRQSA